MRQRALICRLIPQIPTTSQVEIRSLELNPSLPGGWQESSYGSHHECLPGSVLAAGIRRQGGWDMEPKDCNVGWLYPNQHPNC